MVGGICSKFLLFNVFDFNSETNTYFTVEILKGLFSVENKKTFSKWQRKKSKQRTNEPIEYSYTRPKIK